MPPGTCVSCVSPAWSGQAGGPNDGYMNCGRGASPSWSAGSPTTDAFGTAVSISSNATSTRVGGHARRRRNPKRRPRTLRPSLRAPPPPPAQSRLEGAHRARRARLAPQPFELEPRVGGLLTYIKSDRWPELPDGEVTEYEPPRLLGYTWGGDDLRWELCPRDGGCLLILTHTFDDRFKSARQATGWHLCLAALSTSLDHAHVRMEPDGGRLPQGWRELNGHYEERFGIPPDKATPPPQR